MLPGAGLGDDPPLAHSQGEQRLADGVVQLVRTGVTQVLALEVDVGAAEVIAEPSSGIERRRATDEGTPVAGKLELELRVGFGLVPHVLQLLERTHQRLRHVLAAESPETAVDRVGEGRSRHQPPVSASRTARTNARTLSGSFTRARASTPLDTSTP